MCGTTSVTAPAEDLSNFHSSLGLHYKVELIKASNQGFYVGEAAALSLWETRGLSLEGQTETPKDSCHQKHKPREYIYPDTTYQISERHLFEGKKCIDCFLAVGVLRGKLSKKKKKELGGGGSKF